MSIVIPFFLFSKQQIVRSKICFEWNKNQSNIFQNEILWSIDSILVNKKWWTKSDGIAEIEGKLKKNERTEQTGKQVQFVQSKRKLIQWKQVILMKNR